MCGVFFAELLQRVQPAQSHITAHELSNKKTLSFDLDETVSAGQFTEATSYLFLLFNKTSTSRVPALSNTE